MVETSKFSFKIYLKTYLSWLIFINLIFARIFITHLNFNVSNQIDIKVVKELEPQSETSQGSFVIPLCSVGDWK